MGKTLKPLPFRLKVLKETMDFIEKNMLHASWSAYLGDEFEKPYMQNLRNFLRVEKENRKIIYPKSFDVFNAFSYTPFEEVKVVLLGQDPYHGHHQAHGLCFSVQEGVGLPPSLVNIYKELEADLGVKKAKTGCLIPWTQQGVMLLNSVLTVEKGKAASHQGKGWEQFTDVVIDCLNRERSGLVFLLWGSYAQKKGQYINTEKHYVLKAPHPSPFSAHSGFLGCRHFSKTNEYLQKQAKNPIDWRIEKG